MDDLVDMDGEPWRPRRVATATTLVLGDEARDISVRSFRTLKPFDKDRLLAGLRRGKLTEGAQIGVIHYLSNHADPDVRIVIARQGMTKLRRYEPESEQVEWWTLPRTILDVMAVRYASDEFGNLKFTLFGGGGVPQPLLEWFHETFAEIAAAEPQPDSLPPDLVRARCFHDRFIEHLYAVQAQIGDAAHQTIDHTQFKSRGFIDPDCAAMLGLRTAERLLVEAFESQVRLHTPDLDEEVCLRFLVKTEAGSIRLTVPKLAFRKGLRDLSAITRAFYDLCEHAVAEIVGGEAQTVSNLDPGSDESLFAPVADLTRFRKYLETPGNRQRFIDGLELGLNSGHWLPHLRAFEEMLGDASPPGDITDLFARLASGNPEEALRLLRTVEERGLRRLRVPVLAAVMDRYPTLPRELYPLADEVIFQVALRDSATQWSYVAREDVVSALGVDVRAGSIAPAELAEMLRRCARAEHARLLAAHPGPVASGHLSAILTRLGRTAGPGRDDPGAAVLANGDPAVIVKRLLGAGAADDDDAADRILSMFSLPLWPSLRLKYQKGGIVLSNNGIGSAFKVAAGLQLLGDLPPGGAIALPKGTATHPFSFERFAHRWPVVASEEQAAPTPAPIGKARVPMPKLAAFRKQVDLCNTIRGDSQALWSAIEDAYLATRHDGAPNILLLGETGTGKTEFATLLHRASHVPMDRFIKVTASSFADGGDDNIVRGELIGYSKKHGIKDIPSGQKGYVQLAEGGTLFVDDFDGLPPKVQHALLNVLAGGKVRAVGGDEVAVRCRVMLATNADVGAMIESGNMRADLIQRIDVRVKLPALRERSADIFAILSAGAPASAGGAVMTPNRRAWCGLLRYGWPGNVRELIKCSKDAAVVARETEAKEIDIAHLRGLPDVIVAEVAAMQDADVTREVVGVAARCAFAEGYRRGSPRKALGARVAAILGVSEPTASRYMPDDAVLAVG